jgi:hypothetical protein
MAVVNHVDKPPALLPHPLRTAGARAHAPPQLIPCLIASTNASRRRLLRAVAEERAWQAILCRDAGELLAAVRQRRAPLLVIDLPDSAAADYAAMRRAVETARPLSGGLLAVLGQGADGLEEIWARGLGAWIYVNQASDRRHFLPLFDDARWLVARADHERREGPAAAAPAASPADGSQQAESA